MRKKQQSLIKNVSIKKAADFSVKPFFLAIIFHLFFFNQTLLPAVGREFTRLTIEDGLSQSTIFKVIQDHKGYLWITTQDGLNRYDGYSFKVFRHSVKDSSSLSDNSLAQLIQDKNGDIWISTIHGRINQYHYKTAKFTSYQISDLDSTLESDGAYAMAMDSSDNIWFSMNGAIGILNIVSKKITIYESYISGEKIIKPYVYVDENNNIWAGGRSGLYIFNKEENGFELFGLDSLKRSLFKNILIMCGDNSGNIWLGIAGHAPVLFNPRNKSVTKFDKYFSDGDLASFTYLTSIYYTSMHELFIGTFNNGLFVLHPKTGKVEHLINDVYNPKSISFNYIISLFEDRAQNLWVGTLKGLNKLNLKPKKFATFRLNNILRSSGKEKIQSLSNVILSVYKDSHNLIWLGTYTSGLFSINTGTEEIQRYDTTFYKGNNIWSVYELSENEYLIGTNRGLNLFNPKSAVSRFIKFSNSDEKYWVRDIFPKGEHSLYIGTLDKGLLIYDIDKKEVKEAPVIRRPNAKKFKDDILSLYKDHAGILWIGTRLSGLFYYNPQNNELSAYEYQEKYLNKEFSRINSITEDEKHRLWIATENGLVGIKENRKDIICYSIESGLLNSYIYAVETDNQNNIWASSNNGLSKIHFNKYGASLIYNYTMKDGLQANEFNTNCSFKDADGNLYFGGIDGLNVFNPLKIYSNPHVPVIAFNRISVNNKIISPVNENTEIVIEPYYSNLEFTFSALDFTNPANNQYAYKLEGFDRDWVYNGVKNSVRYTGLNPGEYVFYVKGTNNDGLWSEPQSIKVTVLTPIYETAWARVLYVIILILIIIFLIMARTRKVNRDKERLNKKVKEITGELQENYRKLEETRNELINSVKRKAVEVLADGMAHDFNNLLFVILNSAQLLKNSVTSPEKKKLVNNIEVAAIDAAAVIKRIQDFSTKKGYTDRDIVDINQALLDAVELVKPKIHEIEDKKNIIISIKKDIHVNWVTYGNLSEFRLAFTNILINAAEAFDHSGRITITSRFDGENKGIIEISDEGRGMSEDVLANIFDPFYTTKGVHGSGLGLSQAYGIITRHNGIIKAESEPGRGTRIIINLPANPKILNLTPKSKEKSEMHREKNNKQKSILVIEDELVIRELYEEILSMQGYRLEMAETGEEGVAKWEGGRGRFDLVLCDLGLPGLLSGWDVIEKIRKQDQEIPILVVTGWGNTIEKEKIDNYQVNKVLTKPVPVQELVDVIASMI